MKEKTEETVGTAEAAEQEPVTYTRKQKQSEVYTMGLRYAAAAYIFWMGILSLKNAFSGEDGVSVPLAIVIALVFFAAAAGIVLSGLKTWKKIKNAKILPPPEENESDEALDSEETDSEEETEEDEEKPDGETEGSDERTESGESM